jgi:hypothetical protein
MVTIKIYLKGWADRQLFADAVNDPTHPRHADAMLVYNTSFRPYEIGDEIYLAATYTETDEADDAIHCERAFERFNVGDDEIARQYRADGHRSLSVGDLVVIENRAYTVASFGWQTVTVPERLRP